MALTATKRVELLEKFLTENGILEKYYANLTENCKATTLTAEEYIALLCTQDDPSVVFNAAFSYSETPQGAKFWMSMRDKWVSKFKKV